MMTETMTEIKKCSKWTPEYHRKYHLEYYHKHKNVSRDYKRWTDEPIPKEDYYKNYHKIVGQQIIKCDVCDIELKRCQLSYHVKHSKVHKTALQLKEKIKEHIEQLRSSI